MPKILDRSRWILLSIGQDQGGWLDRRGSQIHGRFTTYWRLPDGTQKARDERIHLGGTKLCAAQLPARVLAAFGGAVKLFCALTAVEETRIVRL